MIHSLSIKNFGLFKDISVDFSEGLNVITGESGAGKSMFIKALISLLSGNIPKNLRGENGSISAFITVSDEIKKEIEDFLNLENDEIILNVNFTEKRAVFRANGTIIPKSFLEKIGSYVMEVHTQDSQVLLRTPSYHNLLAYNILKKELNSLIEKYNLKFKEYTTLKNKMSKIPDDPSEIYRKIDILKYQIDEIKSISPEEDEDEKLREEYKKLSNIEEIKNKLSKTLALLKDEEENIDVLIGEVVDDLSDISEYGYSSELDIAVSIQDLINELYSEVENKLYEIESDPEKFEEISNRLSEINNLKRKYGPTLEDVFEHYNSFKKELDDLLSLEKLINELKPTMDKIKKELFKIGEEIKIQGEKVLKKIEKSIKTELKNLNMEHTEIKFEFSKLEEPSRYGTYSIRLKAKTTKQSPLLPIEKIASGGELSRIVLAIEKALGDMHIVETMLFDEIDSGVGQRMADIIGKKLKDFSKNKQLIVITHMPQVANYADKHFKIYKYEEDGITFSNLKELNKDERIEEIKEMYGEIVFEKEVE
ncbi:ATPase involved in DNA repair [Marinitoga piezophila KA3]|uniref:DNA repair protein RecN n=1 Tax=Marinitoga piezophila (strain DSM 14283 / JCM 11233 / KA3) TaxID=443254 RepID=H2J4E3_MARPK|nr:AAA family ATPase [Marinitoga piezophila]AEX84798.1 ATPase involved in DNA repair [Marinitoga piezophila KA3]